MRRLDKIFGSGFGAWGSRGRGRSPGTPLCEVGALSFVRKAIADYLMVLERIQNIGVDGRTSVTLRGHDS